MILTLSYPWDQWNEGEGGPRVAVDARLTIPSPAKSDVESDLHLTACQGTPAFQPVQEKEFQGTKNSKGLAIVYLDQVNAPTLGFLLKIQG